MNKNISTKIDKALDDYKKIIWIYKKSSNTVSSNYDPYRDIGYSSSLSSPIPIRAIVHQISSNGLVAKELGLSVTGAIEIIATDMEASLIKNASKLKYNNNFYTIYNNALGSRVMITQLPFNRTKIVCFIKGNS